MPFGLKNAGSTYQRLVNKLFANLIGKTMDVYIDDMIIKSKQTRDHNLHLRQTFAVLRKYNMKLNPTKCSFRVTSGKFLGYLVTKREIEADPNQIKTVGNLQPPRSVKEVQKLIGCLATWVDSFPNILRDCDPFSMHWGKGRPSNGVKTANLHLKAWRNIWPCLRWLRSRCKGRNYCYTSPCLLPQ